MGLADELRDRIRTILAANWDKREGQKVPESEDLTLGNDAVSLDATVLYADLAGSTKMVRGYKPHFAAEVYKAYLYCAARLIRHEGGVITAYDGDRVMAVFIGGAKNTAAAQCGLRINWAVREVINPAIKAQYPDVNFAVRQVVGIDTSTLWVTRTGVRGANDLVWVGRAANYAAKLTELDAALPTWITASVHDHMNDKVKISKDGRPMWERRTWTAMNGETIYRSSWWWSL